ncbi:phosphoribosyltransferase [Cyclobacterium jeungdonense]|uniref:Phosphoribosyltransferase family protein n=1 Tax=Cyclobacterium jeungdonense TaxID=708087 RepID=A0ABT8CCP9_9BACT|nr:phosphoribosyltransferase family protein [Cyclobacterium jeungdonense]MDN3690171.1 phosphoribosyltransferase family protein [Cyclobacterium jeungdonense]
MFNDRKDAAEKLARALEKYRNKKALVLGIPRGGAETAYYVARHLDTEMSLVITRKLGYPRNPEAAFGAVAEDGSLYISETASQVLSAESMNEVLKEQKKEIQRRIKQLRNGKPLPELKDRTVIIVDDGIATGATLFATIMLCKKMMAEKIVVAAPIAGSGMDETLKRKVDDVVILETPPDFHAVSQGYYDFHNLTDEEALAFMNKWEREYHVKN